jgi:hypothetical protein
VATGENVSGGVNDVVILTGILAFMLISSFVVPMIQNELTGDSQSSINVDTAPSVDQDSNWGVVTNTDVNFIDGLAAVFLWSPAITVIPFWIHAGFWMLDVIIGVLIYRLLRSGGG